MKQKTQNINQITEGIIWRQLLLFFFPIVFGTFFQQLYNTIDTVIVGQFVGKAALASVGGPATQLINLVVGFFTGLSSGASVVIAQFFGAKDERSVKESLHTAYAFSILGSIVILRSWNRTCPAASSLDEHSGRITRRFHLVSADLFCRNFICIHFQRRIQYFTRGRRFQKSALLPDRLLFHQYFSGSVIRHRLPPRRSRCGVRDLFVPSDQTRCSSRTN